MTPPPVPVYRTRSLFLLGEEQRRLFELVQQELSRHHEVTFETQALFNLAEKLKPEWTQPFPPARLHA
jgi:hypothetical protein